MLADEILYLPSLRTSAAIPVAVALSRGGVIEQLVRAELSSDCLPTHRRFLVETALNEINPGPLSERVEMLLGMHFVYGRRNIRVPPSVDPMRWGRNFLALGRQPLAAGTPTTRTRATLGWGTLEGLGVVEHVRKRFHAHHIEEEPFFRGTDGQLWLQPTLLTGLTPVTHWVVGRGALLLMEPVLPTPDKQRIKALREKIGAWREVTRREGHEDVLATSFAAYILEGGAGGTDHKYAVDAMTAAVGEENVMDMADKTDRLDLRARVVRYSGQDELTAQA